MSDTQLKELTLEKYKIDLSVYKDFRESIVVLNARLSNLEKEKKSLESSGWFIFSNIIFFGTFWCLVTFVAKALFGWSVGWLFASFYLSIAFYAATSDFIGNILSFGTINKVKKSLIALRAEIKETERHQASAYEKLKPFEKSSCDYYETQLREFFEKHLYKKRSGSQQFEEAISEFSSTIDQLSSLNSVLVTAGISLSEYKEYLGKRIIDHNIQISKKTGELTAVRDLVRSVSKAHEQKPK